MRSSQQLSQGTCVRFKGNPLGYLNPIAVVIEHQLGGAVFLQTEGSDRACVARHEVAVLRDAPTQPLRFLRHRMPYGKWTCADGREVLFYRDYKPIWQRRPGQAAEAADASERVPYKTQEWFFQDGKQPWRSTQAEKKCNEVLAAWGLPRV